MVLNLDKAKIARCFRRSLPTYDDAALVQNELAGRLLQSINLLPDSAFQQVLEIGCCTGLLTEILCRHKLVETLYLNDLVPDFENVVLNRIVNNAPKQCVTYFGDIETLTLPPDLTLVLSGATFQWLDNLPAFFKRFGRELQPGAYLAFSLFGPGTLKEFSSLTSVELGYHSDKEIIDLLEQNFILESYADYQDKLFFPTVREVLYHIRATGVGGVSEYQWNKETLRDFEARYSQQFSGDKGLPVSYSSSCFVARRR